MRFLEIILENSKIREARLYSAAKKAAANPEIGITIQNKAAYHVIRDCANITLHYLPHFVFGGYESPFQELNGKFTCADIQRFVKETENNIIMKQLLDIILGKAGVHKATKPAYSAELDLADPYGDYGAYDENVVINQQVDMVEDVATTLCDLFGAK